MPSVNKVILVGNLGKDPECKQSQSGIAICSLSLATARKYKDANGQIQEETEWHRISLFGKQAEIAGQYLRKGSLVYIEGRLRTRKYNDKQGIDRYVTEVIGEHMYFLDRKLPAQQAPAPAPVQRMAQPLPADDCPF